jgi:hypothetical protein
MVSLSDTMLATGLMPNLEAVHGEVVTVLDGVDAGRKFTAINEIEPDAQLESELTIDPRSKRMLRFTDRPGNVPSVNTKKLVLIQTSNGKKYSATRQDFSAYLSVDFELVEVIAKDK